MRGEAGGDQAVTGCGGAIARRQRGVGCDGGERFSVGSRSGIGRPGKCLGGEGWELDRAREVWMRR